MDNIEALRYRIAPVEMTESEFRKVGRQVIVNLTPFDGASKAERGSSTM